MKDADNLHSALLYARYLPSGATGTYAEPNLFVTVSWHLADDGKNDVGDRIRSILRLTAQFLRGYGEPMVWVYVQEVSDRKQVHWHWVLFVPHRLQARFKVRLQTWLAAQAMSVVLAGAVVVKPVWSMQGLKHYLMKDGTDEVREKYWVPDHLARSGGIVAGKRAAISRTLRASSRNRDGPA
jgi:hypothetical protein